ncbi:hypothetical protein A3A21_03210 [Candidatus Jorgensenbacteria bacterium RIFCSPLOWO2_01_FULL_45_25b]|uniref:Putative pre-16S rRNA nuclease n=1 Tax=Candidatus Jorgensenbacteria bacterium RIFCSPLOWO2_01_FULL_45_25b TaxID=1798471 RepID=A0A1F6BU09_9BACT|nr:MAG: hypothetical protein A3A21_03210 [Candidatus Jorgensenbacteria bacterium RIFCSPLOWO2_01_FULL_45_25b]
MKFLGIDYGKKRVGIAVSNDDGTMAFPRVVLQNNTYLIGQILGLAKGVGSSEIVLGLSLDNKGAPNIIMKEIEKFKRALKHAGLAVHYEEEFYTSAEAARIQGKEAGNDASAAALILQSFLDRQKNKTG